MSSENPPDPVVLTAELAGGATSEDRILVLPNAVAVLDGASGSDGERTGGWYAEQLRAALATRLGDATVDLRTALSDAIRSVRDRFSLVDNACPSSTVAIVRWSVDVVQALVLGDSTVVAFASGPAPMTLEDNRLAKIAVNERSQLRVAANSSRRVEDARLQSLRSRLLLAERQHRNTPGGYWIAAANPQAAQHALLRSWPRPSVRSALVVSDGVSRHVSAHDAALAWPDVGRQVAAGSHLQLLHELHQAEQPGALRGSPRSKIHDDKSLVAVLFAR